MKEKTNIKKKDTFDPYRINRGGSWYRDAMVTRVSDRLGDRSSDRSSNFGFRLLLQKKKYE